MTNLKKLGLTALAGSLVATTGYAGALDVSGAAKVSYTSGDETEVSGNPFSMTRDISFTGSGEMDNGMTINYFKILIAGGF
jgi:outer membrane protein OmpU